MAGRRARVVLDGRRTDHGGIGRLTGELARSLATGGAWEAVLLLGPGSPATTHLDRGLPAVRLEAPHLSLQEYLSLPAMLREQAADVFVSPQYHTTPPLTVPLVSWVHDTCALDHPEWLPDPKEAFARYGGATARSAAESVMRDYRQARAAGQLFPANEFLRRSDANASPSLASFAVAMFALSVHRSARVVTCSESSRRDILALVPECADRVCVIPNPLPEFVANRKPRRTPPGPPWRILHVSKWEPRKNVVGLLRAMAGLVERVPDATLDLVGAATFPSVLREVLDVLESARLDGRVRLHENISDRDLAELYDQAHAFVMPSFFEGFSIPILEALACGVPVAASAVGAIPELYGDAFLPLDPADPPAMATAIERLLVDEPLRRELATCGTARLAGFRGRDFSEEVRRLLEGVICAQR